MFLTDLADKLRAYQASDGTTLQVIETEGWASRTYDVNGMSGVAGVLWHHTATASAAGYTQGAPTLQMCMYGRSDLPGPLCNIVFGRAGEVYLVAAGEANHAGRGSIGGAYQDLGNYYLIGIEMESSGTSDDWTSEQRRLAPHLGAALDLAYSGGSDFYQVGHKEYSSEGKIDPAYWDMDSFRAEINTLLQGGSVESVSTSPMESAISWFYDRENAVTYSMDYRNGPSSYDCSSAVYYALIQAGIFPSDMRIGNTETEFVDLPAYGFEIVPANADGSVTAQRGDIFIWGEQGSSAGSAGHTGIFVDPDSIIHCNYGYNSITVNNHDVIWSANGIPAVTVYRYKNVAHVATVEELSELEEIMALYNTKEEFEQALEKIVGKRLTAIHDELTPGKAGVKNAGSIFLLLYNLQGHLESFKNLFLPGKEKVRFEGDIRRLIRSISDKAGK